MTLAVDLEEEVEFCWIKEREKVSGREGQELGTEGMESDISLSKAKGWAPSLV